MIDAKFLRTVQEAGWHIESASEKAVTGRCPAQGCQQCATLKPGDDIPAVDPDGHRDRRDIPVETFDDLRGHLRQRREQLGLTIKETEEIGGIAQDHLAKFEKDDSRRLPNAQTAIEWAQALGYQVVLRPGPMTALGLRTIADTRPKLKHRKRRFEIEAERRTGPESERPRVGPKPKASTAG